MLAVLVFLLSTILLVSYLFFPAVFHALDDYDYTHESLVAARNPFRESGPPANMAKLILLRHKIQTTNRKRRSSSHTRQAPRSYASPSRPKPAWIRFRRPFGAKQLH